jgi:hypothetical protein
MMGVLGKYIDDYGVTQDFGVASSRVSEHAHP